MAATEQTFYKCQVSNSMQLVQQICTGYFMPGLVGAEDTTTNKMKWTEVPVLRASIPGGKGQTGDAENMELVNEHVH